MEQSVVESKEKKADETAAEAEELALEELENDGGEYISFKIRS